MPHATASTPTYSRFRVEPYTPNIGAFIHGLDLAHPIDRTTAEELRHALLRHEVLFLRDQTLNAAQQVVVARVFGDPALAKAYFPRSTEQPLVEVIETKAGGPRYTTDQWHVDVSYLAVPPAGAVLHAQDLPPAGGDTLWASGRAAYRALARGLANYLEGLYSIHTLERSAWPDLLRAQTDGEQRYRAVRDERLPQRHPLILKHPVSGEKILFANPKYVDRIEGLSRAQSDALLGQLFDLFERPETQARLRWAPGTVAIWDNLSTVHYAVADYLPAYRRMHRVTF